MKDFVDAMATVRTAIKTGTYATFNVESDCDDEPSFAYTVGLHSVDMPELVVIGELMPETAGHVIEVVRLALLDNPKLACTGMLHELGVRLTEVDTSRAAVSNTYAMLAFEYYSKEREKIKLIQIHWPDNDGHFYDDANWDGGPYVALLDIFDGDKYNTPEV